MRQVKDFGLTPALGNEGVSAGKKNRLEARLASLESRKGKLELLAPFEENKEWEAAPSEETDGLELLPFGQR